MILVTGGAGYIGSHTCIELIEQGHEVVVVDNLINSAVEAISRIEEITGKSVAFIEGDVRDESVLCDIFNQFKFGLFLIISYNRTNCCFASGI